MERGEQVFKRGIARGVRDGCDVCVVPQMKGDERLEIV